MRLLFDGSIYSGYIFRIGNININPPDTVHHSVEEEFDDAVKNLNVAQY